MWGAVIAAVDAAVSAQRHQYERDRDSMAPWLIVGQRAPGQIQPPKQATGKCPCCGSRQFVIRNEARVCTYCRSEQ